MSLKRKPKIIFIVNTASGGLKGPELLEWAIERNYVSFNLSNLSNDNQRGKGERSELKKHLLNEENRNIVFICGGDGTPSWAITTIDRTLLEDDYDPSNSKSISFLRAFYATKCTFRILPLGTGNDISQVLGCGAKFPGFPYLPLIIRSACQTRAPFTYLDNWRIEHRNESGKLSKWITNHMFAYCSFGGSASVSADFHHKRQEKPTRYKNRYLNKTAYAFFGAKKIFTKEPAISGMLQANDSNDEMIQIPEKAKELIFANVNSISGGMDLLKGATEKPKELVCCGDSKLECYSANGISAYVAARLRITKYNCLGQFSKLSINLTQPQAVQVDGECVSCEIGRVTLQHFTSLRFIVGREGDRNIVRSLKQLPEWLLDLINKEKNQSVQQKTCILAKKINLAAAPKPYKKLSLKPEKLSIDEDEDLEKQFGNLNSPSEEIELRNYENEITPMMPKTSTNPDMDFELRPPSRVFYKRDPTSLGRDRAGSGFLPTEKAKFETVNSNNSFLSDDCKLIEEELGEVKNSKGNTPKLERISVQLP